jgi:glycosyltransferase involved in cell wall biosynthesis
MSLSVQISIVTRTFNRPDLLARVAKHLSSQTYQNFEWIIINDGGDKESLEPALIEFAPLKPRIIVNKNNLGRGHSALIGMETAKGKYLLIHDDDDWLEYNALENLFIKLESSPSAVASICGYNIHRSRKALFSSSHKKTVTSVKVEMPPKLQDIAYQNSLLTISTLFRRDIAMACGGINPDLDVLEDWDLWLRLLLKGDMVVCPMVLANQELRPQESGYSANTKRVDHLTAMIKIQNHHLRNDLNAGTASLGVLLNPHNRNEFERIDYLLRMIQSFVRIFRFKN